MKALQDIAKSQLKVEGKLKEKALKDEIKIGKELQLSIIKSIYWKNQLVMELRKDNL